MTDISAALGPADLRAFPIFPLPRAVLFPDTLLPLHVFEPRYRAMIADVLAGDRVLGVAHLREGFEGDYDGRPPVHSVLGVGRVTRDVRLPDGRYNILIEGMLRARIAAEHAPLQAYRTVRADVIRDRDDYDAGPLAAVERQVSVLWNRLGPRLPEPVRSFAKLIEKADSVGARANRLGDVILTEPDARQAFLEEPDPGQRFYVVLQRLHDLTSTLSEEPGKGPS